jgi:hypothetical protein
LETNGNDAWLSFENPVAVLWQRPATKLHSFASNGKIPCNEALLI